MARHREIHDRILSLMALHAYALSTDEVAGALGITHWRARHALTALHILDAVVKATAPSRGPNGGQGRPGMLWSLAGAKPLPPELVALLRRFPPDTVVVTPSNREARIVAVGADARATLAYLDGDPDGPPIKLSLLVAFQPGRARPLPVRIKD